MPAKPKNPVIAAPPSDTQTETEIATLRGKSTDRTAEESARLLDLIADRVLAGP